MQEDNPREMSDERLAAHLKYFGELYQTALTNLAK